MIATLEKQYKLMQHIQQPGPCLCMAACCAMLTNQDIQDVLNKCRLLKTKNGFEYLPNNEAMKYLAGYNLQHGLTIGLLDEINTQIDCDTTHLNFELDLRQFPAILTVPSPTFGDPLKHAIIYDNEKDIILDPLLAYSTKRKDYKVLAWTPIVDLLEFDI